MSKITRIIDTNFRSGTGKTGKPWVMMKVEVDGKEATIFAPAAEGDEVKLTYNEQYKNYTAEKMTAQKKQQEETEDTLKLILSSLGRIEMKLGINGIKEPAAPIQDVIIGPDESLDERIDYSDIPF